MICPPESTHTIASGPASSSPRNRAPARCWALISALSADSSVIVPVLSAIEASVTITVIAVPSCGTGSALCSSSPPPGRGRLGFSVRGSFCPREQRSLCRRCPLGGGVAVEPLGSAVPGRDEPIKVKAEDRVMGGFDDRCQPGLASAACRCWVTSRTAADTRMPWPVSRADRAISAGKMVPSRRRQDRFTLAPISRGWGSARVLGAQDGVACLARVGDQDLDRLAGQFFARVPEQPLGLGVDQHDLPAGVHAHRRVGCRLQQPGDDGISSCAARSGTLRMERITLSYISRRSTAAADVGRLPRPVLLGTAHGHHGVVPGLVRRRGSVPAWPVAGAVGGPSFVVAAANES